MPSKAKPAFVKLRVDYVAMCGSPAEALVLDAMEFRAKLNSDRQSPVLCTIAELVRRLCGTYGERVIGHARANLVRRGILMPAGQAGEAHADLFKLNWAAIDTWLDQYYAAIDNGSPAPAQAE
jgi:hypothetical protein